MDSSYMNILHFVRHAWIFPLTRVYRYVPFVSSGACANKFTIKTPTCPEGIESSNLSACAHEHNSTNINNETGINVKYSYLFAKFYNCVKCARVWTATHLDFTWSMVNVRRLLFAFSPWIMQMQICIQTYEWVRRKMKTEKSECLYLSHKYFMNSYYVIWHMHFVWLCSARSIRYATIAVFVDGMEQTNEILHFENSILSTQRQHSARKPFGSNESHMRYKIIKHFTIWVSRRQALNDSTSTRKRNE